MKGFACVAVASLLAPLLLAGCGEPKKDSTDVIILGGQTVTETKTDLPTGGKGLGHIAGFVVDSAIRTISGATVHLVSLDQHDVTDRTGGFEFIDLKPGSYLLKINATGYERAESYVDVKADKFTRVKVILKQFPPPEPRVEVAEYKGYAEATNVQVARFLQSSYSVRLSPDNLTGFVIEATMDENPGGSNGFTVELDSINCCATIHRASAANPFWTQVEPSRLKASSYRLYMAPWSSPVPELQKEFQVFTSAFYGQSIPAGYSVVAGA
jgi:hypothetical protein